MNRNASNAAASQPRANDGTFGEKPRGEAEVDLTAPGPVSATAVSTPERPYRLLDEPQVTRSITGAEATNYTAEPISDEAGIFAYGGSCDPTAAKVPNAIGDVPGRAFPYSGSVHARDDAALSRVRGVARSQAEGWDRIGAANGAWAATYDRRPSTLTDRANHEARFGEQAWDREQARDERLRVADALDEAVAARKALPRYPHPLMPSKRRAAKAADAVLADAWAAYQVAYPDAAPKS